uniref:Secreted protein n=1 Tax=Strongyloides venezuelensis TaxID=75913 RepID=A0A0K0F0Z8_STRVS
MLHKGYFFVIYFITLSSTAYGCMSSKPTDPPVVSTTTIAPSTTTTASSTCQNKDNKAMVYMDPSVDASGNPAIAGSKTGTPCDQCANTKYFDPATNDVFAGTDAINTYQCPDAQPLCICDETECYKETDKSVSVSLYPYCASASDCAAYAIISAQADTMGVGGADGTAVWTPDGTVDANFNFLPVSSGKFMKVSAISCGTCPVSLTDPSCLPITPTMA